MYTFLLVIYVFVSLFLILVVLLQPGKGAGMGAAFGGSSATMFGSRSQATPMHKITTILAVLFMVLAVGLAYFSSGEISALDTQKPPEREAGLSPLAQEETTDTQAATPDHEE